VWCESLSAVVSNCVLTGNSAYRDGGGAYRGTLNECTLKGNSASSGGGAYNGTLNNCTLTGNSASYGGGGASSSTLNNCTLTGNSAGNYGGGANYGTLKNCIVYYNSASSGLNYSGSTFNYSCTMPLPASGTGNISNAPLFADTNGWANLRLQSNSPCINAGNNAYVTAATDLDGLPRIAGCTVDVGAHEFQGAGLSGFTAWLWQFGLPIDGSADYMDADCDGHNSWQEWVAGTDPTNAASALRLIAATPNGSDVVVSWQSEAGVSYFVERNTNLTLPLFTRLATNITGQPGATAFTDTNANGLSPVFYRVAVGE
jgi:hypothetical protein